MVIGVPRETFGGERRVALTPRACEALIKLKLEVVVEFSAGLDAGFLDEDYARRGVGLAAREAVFQEAGVIVQARAPGANPERGGEDLALLKQGQILIGFGEPLTAIRECAELADRGVSFLAMELVPRITRAQAMDALSSMASIAGYGCATGGNNRANVHAARDSSVKSEQRRFVGPGRELRCPRPTGTVTRPKCCLA